MISTKTEFLGPQLILFGKKDWSNFGANLLHPNFDFPYTTGSGFRFRLLLAKLTYYFLQQFL